MKIFNKYLIKRSFLISLFIFVIFALLDLVFNFISELENISTDYTFFSALKFVFISMPHNASGFLEGACLLGVMISLGISHEEGNLNVLRSSGQSPIKIILTSSLGTMLLVLSFIAIDETYFRNVHLNAEVERSLKLNKQKQVTSDNQWVKGDESILSYSNIINDTIFNIKFIKLESNKALYFKTADSAKIYLEEIIFDDTLKSHSFNSEQNNELKEKFIFPLVARIPFKNIESLSIYEIRKYQEILLESSLSEDILFRSHLNKSYFKRVFYPFSILAVIIFFGSFIFGSLRDSSPASRVVIAVVGGFSYKVIQDFSISFFISFGYPVFIGVVMPAIVLLMASLFLYKRI